MALLTGLGALLGGATEEANKIHQERAQKEQADLQLTTSMLQHIIENPNIYDPSVKAQAQEAWRDVVLEHLFPQNFKGGKTNQVRKMVDQFVGAQSTAPGMAQALQGPGRGEGAGKGNAMTSVGGLQTPPPPPPQSSGAGSQQPQAGGPPSPASAGLDIPTTGGFGNPLQAQFALQHALHQDESNIQQAALPGKLTAENTAFMDKAKQAFDSISQNPDFQKLSNEQKLELQSSLFGGHISPGREPQHVSSFNASTGKMELKQILPDGTVKTISESDLPPSANKQEYEEMATALVGNPAYKGMTKDQIYQKLRLDDHAQKAKVQDAQIQASQALQEYRNYLRTQQAAKLPPEQKQMYDQAKDIFSKASIEVDKDMAAWRKSKGEFDAMSPALQKSMGAYMQLGKQPGSELPGEGSPEEKLLKQYATRIAASRNLNIENLAKLIHEIEQKAMAAYEAQQQQQPAPPPIQ